MTGATPPPARARLFNVKFSPNLGDGLLAECLEAGLIHHGLPAASTWSVDLAGRTAYAPGAASRGRMLGALSRLPAGVRQAVLSLPLALWRRRSWAPHYRKGLEEVDAVVIGGGNLFADIDLNFPTKLAAVLDEATARGIPVMIFGVGVTGRWSARGRRIVHDALAAADVAWVGVRDTPSLANFDALFGDAVRCTPRVVRDPGLAVSRLKPCPAAEDADDVVGVCITAALAVRYHSDVALSDAFLLRWYMALLDALVADGRRVLAFTNGSPEDVEFAHRLFASNPPGRGVELVARPDDPDALVRLVSGCSGVVAFRMHTIIAAVSCGVGVVALRWDPKLDAFMQSVGLGDFILSTERAGADDVVAALRVSTARMRGVIDVESLVDDALADMGALAEALQTAPNAATARVGPTRASASPSRRDGASESSDSFLSRVASSARR